VNRGTVEANWKPLEKRLGTERCAGFMFMGRVNGINRYKHGISRSYLNLDDEGNCYVAAEPGYYLLGDFDREVAKLEECLKALQATFETQPRREFHRTKARSVETAGDLITHTSS
jgi:hypothetical protein